MNRKSAGKSLVVACLLTACLANAGCRRFGGGVGETVPSPPRELIEKSYQSGPAPAAPSGAGRSGGRATGPR